MTELAMREQIQLDARVIESPLWQGIRITNMINQAQNWLQGKLIEQGYKKWSDASTVSSLSPSAIEGVTTAKGDIPVDMLRDKPVESVFPTPAVAGSYVKKSWKSVIIKNFNFVANNPVTAPSTQWGVYTTDVDSIHIYPAGSFTAIALRYIRKITDMVFDDDAVDSEIPEELQWVLIERVVMQIKSIDGNEQVKQVKLSEIDKELMNKYQLDAFVKQKDQDRSQVQ